ncbi:uncharacterized protein LOC127852826 isoform X2 [Dreissena polymorpha]|uniref:uncharacterized protein LOC127852826 isoform X2 n=1 Tax=Dreissena polymorpha TaxID=45954 RepID=UPI0022641C46|nr:uncharacterized protein LOC127852826 isoform X2 [Dreissena polymorpha]
MSQNIGILSWTNDDGQQEKNKRKISRPLSETSATPTSPQRTTTEYQPPTNLDTMQTASQSHPMTSATTSAAYKATAATASTSTTDDANKATVSGTSNTNDAYRATASSTSTANEAYTATASSTSTANDAYTTTVSSTSTTNAAYKATAASTSTTNSAYDITASETATYISTSLQIPTGVSSVSPHHPRVNAATISGGVAGVLGLLILVLLVKVYVRQRKIIKERDILMMSMYLTPRQTPLKKHRFKYTASNEELKQEEDVTEQERDSYMEPLVHRQIWQLLDRSPVLTRRAEEKENRKGTMYSSIRISENTAQRLQYIARCLGPNDALLKKQSITSLQTSLNDDYSQVKTPGAKRMELNDAPRWSTDSNHYEFVAGSTVDETEAENTVIYDDVILEQTEQLRYTKPQVGDNFNARMVRSRSTESVLEECRGNNPKRLTTAPRNSTIDIRGSVIDNVKPFTYKLVGEMKLVTNEG